MELTKQKLNEMMNKFIIVLLFGIFSPGFGYCQAINEQLVVLNDFRIDRIYGDSTVPDSVILRVHVQKGDVDVFYVGLSNTFPNDECGFYSFTAALSGDLVKKHGKHFYITIKINDLNRRLSKKNPKWFLREFACVEISARDKKNNYSNRIIECSRNYKDCLSKY